MCDTQTLAYSSEGYIIRCAACGKMQLAFGPVAFLIKKQQFHRLREQASAAMRQKEVAGSDPDLKSVTLMVSRSSLFCLTHRELGYLTDLLDQAYALLEVYEMLAVE